MLLKNLLIPASLMLLFACGTSRHATTAGGSTSTPSSGNSDLHFIDNVSINPGKRQLSAGKEEAKRSDSSYAGGTARDLRGIEGFSVLQFKYSILMNVSVEDIDDPRLFHFIDNWYGTSYHYGGQSKEGIDCSAFICLLMDSVYGIRNIPRVSKDQYAGSKKISRKELRRGDLVFFHTMARRRTVTHVGFYLANNKFVHASSSGVMISDLTEPYFAGHFVGAGRWPTL